MPALRLTGFIGEQPHIIPELLPPNAAQAAINVRLDDGALTPIRKSVLADEIGDPNHTTIFLWQGEWISWEGQVHAVPGPVADDRLYFTGDGKPKLRVTGTDYDLELPAPTGALTATLGGTGSGDVVTRIYVYTWVTAFGEESEPCPVSNEIDWQPGNTVQLSGFAAAPAGRNITKQRIYRSQTGQSGTFFYLIHERAAANTNYDDTVAVDAFAEPLPSSDYNTPPDELEGLVEMPNGMMAAYVGRDLYFSEPFRPHAWPQKYVQTTAYPIMGLGVVGDVLVVTTTGTPYVAQGAHPSVVLMKKLEANLPCINKRAVVELGFGVAYPSHEGLVVVDGAGGPRLVSQNLFNRDDWLELSPGTMVAGQLAGRYVAFYDTTVDDVQLRGCLFIDAGQSPFLIRGNAVAAATFYDLATGALYYLDKGTDDVMRLDSPEGSREIIYWRSKAFTFNTPENMGVILVRAASNLTDAEQATLAALIAAILAANEALIDDGLLDSELGAAYLGQIALGSDLLQDVPAAEQVLSVGVIADGVRVAQILTSNKPQRLPSGFRATVWEVDVTGDQQVKEILIGRTMDDLKAVPAS